jgi:chorismate-pyruvate lyase
MTGFSLAHFSVTVASMKWIDLQTKLNGKARHNAQSWLMTSRSLTDLLTRLARPQALEHNLSALGWLTVGVNEQEIWPDLNVGQRLWQRVVHFKVQDQPWLHAHVLIPESSLCKAEGLALQYCGARSLGFVLFQDPHVSREPVSYGYHENGDELWLTRHSQHSFFSKPLFISESFSPLVWQQDLP